MRNVFDYLEYSFFTLFSKRGIRIIGSSILLDIIMSVVTLTIVYQSALFFGKEYWENGVENLNSLILQILLVILWVFTLGIINIWWKVTVIPLRSLESEEKSFNFNEDLSLVKKYFWYYLSYITWYSVFLLLWIILAIGWGALFWMAEKPLLIFLYESVLVWVLCVFQIWISLAWYNILINPVYWVEGLRAWYRLSNWIKWKLFKMIFVFSLVISLANGIITNLNSLIPSPDISEALNSLNTPTVSWEDLNWNNEASTIKMSKETPWLISGTPSEKRIPFQFNKESIEALIHIVQAFLPNISIFVILMSVEWVLATAMMQIFLMRLTMDVRTEIKPQKKEDNLN